jgi:hypothetical protein
MEHGRVILRRYITRKRDCGEASRRWSAAAGVTITELLVVLALLGLMAAIAVPTFVKGGFFSKNEPQLAVMELYKFMNSARIYSSTYRVNTAVAYGVNLRIDSLSGLALESVDAVAMVYKVPDQIAKYCKFYSDINGNDMNPPMQVEGDIYVPVVGEHERGFFRALPGDAAMIADNLLPDGSGYTTLRDSMDAIRVYRLTQVYDRDDNDFRFSAQLVAPLRIADNDSNILTHLPDKLQYLASLPEGAKFLEYQPDFSDVPSLLNVNDFRLPAHIFTPSGRMNSSSSAIERFIIEVGYPPDADPVERFANSSDRSDGLRVKTIEVFRATGRASIVVD